MKKTGLISFIFMVLSFAGVSQNITTSYVYEMPVICFGQCNGYFEIQAQGGTAPYTVDLIGIPPDSQMDDSTFTYSTLCPGGYQAIVRDALGDSLVYNFEIFEPSPLQIALGNANAVTCSGSCDGSISVVASGGEPPYQYVWDDPMNQTTAVVTGLCTGIYICTVTDSYGCQTTLTTTIQEPTPMELSIAQGPDCGNNCSGWASPLVTGGTAPYAYSWNDGSTIPDNTGMCYGTYYLDITDANGCSIGQVVQIDTSDSPIEIIINDVIDASCADGAIDISVTGGTGYLDISWLHGATDPLLFGLNAGTYTVEVYDEIGCYDSAMVNVHDLGSGNCSTIEGTVYYDYDENCSVSSGDVILQHVIVLADPTPGAGFEGDEYYAMTDDFGMYFFNIPYGTYTVSQLPFNNYGDHCSNGGISVTTNSSNLYVSNVDFYDTLVSNIDAAVNSFSWAIRPGFNTTHAVTVRNYGQGTGSGYVYAVYPSSQLTYSGASPSPSFINGDTLIWNLPVIDNVVNTFYIYGTASNVNLGDMVTLCAEVVVNETDINLPNNEHCGATTVTGSYDPNDKSVSPAGDITLQDQTLDYLIRFQNTGTDTAFNVVIADTISSKLDLGAFEVLESSHPMQVELNGNVLKFVFSDILLPDSNVNEPASHGYVQYRINQASGNQVGDEITNTAYIYFDFNEAIVTNTTSSLITVPSTVYEWADVELNVYPNPFSNEINVRSDNRIDAVKLIDNLGRLVYSKTLNAYNYQFSTEELSKGIYTLEILANGQLKREKIIKQ